MFCLGSLGCGISQRKICDENDEIRVAMIISASISPSVLVEGLIA